MQEGADVAPAGESASRDPVKTHRRHRRAGLTTRATHTRPLRHAISQWPQDLAVPMQEPPIGFPVRVVAS
jgi:hypothetical protein